MNYDLMQALHELTQDRGISMEVLQEAIEAAIASAYKKHYNAAGNIRVDFGEGPGGDIKVYSRRRVVEEVTNPQQEISLEEARAIDPSYQVGDYYEEEVTPKDFGRIAAQTAKQVVIQRIREAERDLVYDEYIERVDDIVTGIVQRVERRNVYIDLGRVEAVLPPHEQMPNERYHHGDRLKTYIVDVSKTTKGPVITVSRANPGLLKRLFELEVPEIFDGIVEIKSVAREPGSRSKIAVFSNDRNVDPVGACVGQRGSRVQTIVNELRGEKIDIVEWDEDIGKFVANALSPAKVEAVYPKPSEKIARVVVNEDQLSLAIGKEGQNARLAAKLTGWKVDIKTWDQMQEILAKEAEEEEAARKAAEEEAKQAEEEEIDTSLLDEVVAQIIEEGIPEKKEKAKKPTILHNLEDLRILVEGNESDEDEAEDKDTEPEAEAKKKKEPAPDHIDDDLLDDALADLLDID
ncbi:MAG: transcription termination/antitermination protein NusA [Firmicutes bacterium]|nr:transcription termination/antitermination protein NusA [Bacillota bacterium]